MAISNDLHRTFCINLRALRTELGLTQKEVADRMGITQPGYASIESGRTVPGIDVLDRVARALGSTPARLLADKTAARETVQRKVSLAS